MLRVQSQNLCPGPPQRHRSGQRSLPKPPSHLPCGTAALGSSIVRAQLCVAHHHVDCLGRYLECLADEGDDDRLQTLADLGASGERRDRPVGSDQQPIVVVEGLLHVPANFVCVVKAREARLLGRRFSVREKAEAVGHECPASGGDELSAWKLHDAVRRRVEAASMDSMMFW